MNYSILTLFIIDNIIIKQRKVKKIMVILVLFSKRNLPRHKWIQAWNHLPISAISGRSLLAKFCSKRVCRCTHQFTIYIVNLDLLNTGIFLNKLSPHKQVGFSLCKKLFMRRNCNTNFSVLNLQVYDLIWHIPSVYQRFW